MPCSSTQRRLEDGGTTVPDKVVRESIGLQINRDFGSSGTYRMSSKIDGGEHQLRTGNPAREKVAEDGGGE